MQKRKLPIITAIFVVLALSFLVFCFWIQPPHASKETLFVGGTIVTMDDKNPTPEAVLVRDGRIISATTEAAARALATDDVEVVDLNGQTMLPGFIEPHTHPMSAATLGAVTDVSGFTNKNHAEVIESLKAGVANGGNNGWVVAYGWDPVMLPDLHAPTLEELDALSPDMPMVILTQMMHDAYANSRALEAAGITKDTEAPQGSEFMKDKNGELTGTVREVGAIGVLMNAIPKPPEGAYRYLLATQFPKYARAGYTTLGAMGIVIQSDDPLGDYQAVTRMDNAPVRSVIYALPNQLPETSKPDDNAEQGGVIGVKFWMDGSPFAGGAAFEEPYENTELVKERLHLGHNHLAALNYDQDNFETLFQKYHDQGYQVAVHVQGERAVKRVLDAAEAALKANPRVDHRHRLEHGALISKEQLERAHSLGMTTSFFVDHVYFYGHALSDLVGQERVNRYMPLKTALNTGQKISVHTDNPASPIGSLRVMRTARQRLSRTGSQPMATPEALSPEEALKAMTIDAAWQLGLEHETGSITAGKSADFVILSDNPLTTRDADLENIKIIQTWLRGQPTEWRLFNQNSFKAAVNIIWNML